MKTLFFSFFYTLLVASFFISCAKNVSPKPYGVLPTESQVRWQQLEYYMFMHFGPNTFTNVEWGDGKEDPAVFNPTDLDCRQWAATAKAAGMKGIIITAKHHDGFCLWPSKYSTHTVRESPWKDGKGDVLKELSQACKEYDLKFGVYLSPWDQNHPAYGTPEYNQVFANTLDEVLSGYGEVFEQWFDGAKGGEGKNQTYDRDLFHTTVYKNQPQAIIFSDVGPGCRWMGNERGVAGETNWSRMNIEGFEPGLGAPPTEVLNSGEMGGAAWVPAETDVSIRPGWFYSPSTDDKVKSVEKLMDIYYTSVGRNSNLLLNVPPDRRGKIHPNDSIRLMEFRDAINNDFKDDLLRNADVKASNTVADSYRTAYLQDENYDTYWTAEDGIFNPSLEIDFKEQQRFNRLMLQEYIPLGQRVTSFVAKYWDEETENWKELVKATTIGYKRILRFPAVTTSKIKIEFEALANPAISKIGVFLGREFLATPVIGRDRAGMVTIKSASADPVIYYTTNGDDPDMIPANRYAEGFMLVEGGTVKAIAVVENGEKRSEVVSKKYGIASDKWSIVSPKGCDVVKVSDDNTRTYIEVDTKEPFVLDIGKVSILKTFSYTPVPNVETSNIAACDVFVSEDGRGWEKALQNNIFDNIRNNPVKQELSFPSSVKARYIKIVPLELANKGDKYHIAEIDVSTQ